MFKRFFRSVFKPSSEQGTSSPTTPEAAAPATKQSESTASKTMSKKAIHFGGGNIGRGFVAEFLHKSGYEVVFIDVMDDLIKAIQDSKSYEVTEVGTRGVTHFTITNYRAINSKHDRPKVVEEISTADLVTCAVGPNILPRIAAVIAEGIDARKSDTPLAVIACENAIGATDTLAGHIKEALKTSEADLPNKVRYANSAIDRIVPQQEPDAGLNVKIERFYEWCVEELPFKNAKGGRPTIDGVHFVGDLTPYIERKLFTVNTSHATAAYFGYNKGYKTVQESMKDEEINKQTREAIKETAHLIVNKHGITQKDQDEYMDRIIRRISNPHLEDIVDRVGRAPIRKLSRHERFIGPAAELAERGDPVDALLRSVEMALRFQNVEGDEESVELAKILKEMSSKDATKKLTELEEDHPLFDRVEKLVAKVQGSTS